MAAFALIAVPAVAPPPQLSADQLLKLYDASHAQHLTANGCLDR